jgi:hypothetical protein
MKVSLKSSFFYAKQSNKFSKSLLGRTASPGVGVLYLFIYPWLGPYLVVWACVSMGIGGCVITCASPRVEHGLA